MERKFLDSSFGDIGEVDEVHPSSPSRLESLAREVLEDTALTAPMDAFELAECCGVEVRFWPGDKGKYDGRIWCPGGKSLVFQHGTVAHELGHWTMIERANRPIHHEDDARYLAGAYMLPRQTILDDLHRKSWDLLEVHPLHPNASWQMLVIRCSQVAEAYASVWDGGRCTGAYGIGEELLEEHRQAVLRVLETGRAERGAVDAYPVFSPGHRRVVCVERAG